MRDRVEITPGRAVDAYPRVVEPPRLVHSVVPAADDGCGRRWTDARAPLGRTTCSYAPPSTIHSTTTAFTVEKSIVRKGKQ